VISNSKSSSDDESYVFDVDVPPLEPDIQAGTTTTSYEKLAHSGDDGIAMANNGGADPQVSPSKTDASNTPRQTNIFVPKEVVPNDHVQAEDTDGSIMTDGLAEMADLTEDIAWVATEEATGFRQVHYRLFETVTAWISKKM